MFRLGAASPVVAMAVLAGACAGSPTAPSSTTSSASLVGSVSQTPPVVPQAIIPVPPQALGAQRFVAFGDSITSGTLSSFDGMFLYADEPGSYPRRLNAMLDAYNRPAPFSVINRGEPGESAHQGSGRLPAVLASDRPQVLLLLEGINDMSGGVSAERTASSVAYMVEVARLHNVTVLVATMPQTYHSVDPQGRERDNAAAQVVPFNAEVRRLVGGQQNVHIVDLYAAFGNDRSLMGGDGLHPSPAGYERMAQTFHAAISTIFTVRGSLQ
jgi:lysophospholipase L1-like esterase